MYRPYASVAAFAGIITMLALAVLGQQQTTAPVSSPQAAEKVAQRPDQGQTEASQDEVRQLLAAPRKPEPPKAAPAPPPPPPKYPNNVDGWIAEGLDVLRDTGTPVGPRAHERLKRVAWHESSFRPDVVNTWDSNAAKGIPSIGLMQTIQPTFDAYKLPGHDDIRNPVDNTIAATRYMFDRYGSIEQHPGIESLESGGEYEPY